MADKVIKEHYVPKRYLKHFSTENKFFVYDREKKQKRPGNVGDYACERYFYDVDFEQLKKEKLKEDPNFVFDPEIETEIQEIDQQHIEHFLGQKVETDLYNPIEKIITLYTMCNRTKINTIQLLSNEEINDLLLYLAIQVIRTKEFREAMTEMYERLPLYLMKKMANTEDERKLIDAFELKIKSENIQKLFHADFLMNPDIVVQLATAIRRKTWIVGFSKSDALLYTSDNPVVKYSDSLHAGFDSNGTEIIFPLNTRLVLILEDPEYYWFDAERHNHFIEITNEDVLFYNSLQVVQSYRYIFSKTNDFSLVEEIMKKSPELSTINRKRFVMS